MLVVVCCLFGVVCRLVLVVRCLVFAVWMCCLQCVVWCSVFVAWCCWLIAVGWLVVGWCASLCAGSLLPVVCLSCVVCCLLCAL